jgi:hypothetical protein
MGHPEQTNKGRSDREGRQEECGGKHGWCVNLDQRQNLVSRWRHRPLQVHAHLHIQEKDAGVYFFFVYTARPRILQKPCNLVGGLTRERINDLCPTIVGKGKEGKEKVCVCEREREGGGNQ